MLKYFPAAITALLLTLAFNCPTEAQRSTSRAKPLSKPVKKAPTEEEVRAQMVPRNLTVSFTINGSNSYPLGNDTTVEWHVDRKYSAAVELRKLLATCDVRTCNVVEWTGYGDPPYIDWDVSADDSLIVRTTYKPKQKDAPPLTKTKTVTVKCTGSFSIQNLALFHVNIQDPESGLGTATAGIPFPGLPVGPGVCVRREVTRGDPQGDPPDKEYISYYPPDYYFPDSVEGFRAKNFQSIEFPILATSLLDVANKNITFATPVLEANVPRGVEGPGTPPSPQKVKMQATYSFK